MLKITAIKQQKRKGRFNIYIDGKFSFALSTEALAKAGLVIGQEISKKDIGILRNKDIKNKLYNLALRFLSYRPRSEKEVRDYLRKKISTNQRFDRRQSAFIELILKKLKSQNLIDDTEFVRWWIEQRQTYRPKGIYALRQELRRKGISEKIIDSLLTFHFPLSTERASARRIAEKKLEKLKKLSYRDRKGKLSAFLLRRGFSYETIKLVLDEILKKK